MDVCNQSPLFGFQMNLIVRLCEESFVLNEHLHNLDPFCTLCISFLDDLHDGLVAKPLLLEFIPAGQTCDTLLAHSDFLEPPLLFVLPNLHVPELKRNPVLFLLNQLGRWCQFVILHREVVHDSVGLFRRFKAHKHSLLFRLKVWSIQEKGRLTTP